MENWLLKLVHLFDFFFKKQGIDLPRMYTIVQTKLVMDKRRVFLNWRQGAQSENSNHLRIVLAMYVFISLFISVAIYSEFPFLFSMMLFHAYVIFMMAMVLITDFSSVVLDTTDNQIILPKPVDGKTLFMARQVHILLYLLLFTTAMTFIPLISIGIKFGLLTALVSLVTVFLCVLLAVFATYYFYLLALRFSSEKRVKDIITWFQIVLTVFFAIGYQLILRFIDLDDISGSFELSWYSWLLPPVWMSYTVEAVHLLNFDSIHLLMILLAFCVPVLLYWVLTKYLSPGFAATLSSLNAEHNAKPQSSSIPGRSGWAEKLSPFFTREPIGKAGFENTWKITSRDKSFKLHFYPSLAYIFVFIFIFVFNAGKNVEASWNILSTTNKFLWFIYLPMFTVANGILFVTFNENFAASWIYHSTPLKKPGQIILGSWLALLIKYFFPVYFLMFLISVYIWGWQVADDFVFGLANDYLCYLILGYLNKQYLPFSRQPSSRQQAGRFLLALMQMVIVGVMVLLHLLVIRQPSLFYIVLAVILIICWLLEKYIANLSWNKISV